MAIPALALCIAAAALGVDIGRIAVDKRSDQKVADMAALDAARAVGLILDTTNQAGYNSAAQTAAVASVARNGFTVGSKTATPSPPRSARSTRHQRVLSGGARSGAGHDHLAHRQCVPSRRSRPHRPRRRTDRLADRFVLRRLEARQHRHVQEPSRPDAQVMFGASGNLTPSATKGSPPATSRSEAADGAARPRLQRRHGRRPPDRGPRRRRPLPGDGQRAHRRRGEHRGGRGEGHPRHRHLVVEHGQLGDLINVASPSDSAVLAAEVQRLPTHRRRRRADERHATSCRCR